MQGSCLVRFDRRLKFSNGDQDAADADRSGGERCSRSVPRARGQGAAACTGSAWQAKGPCAHCGSYGASRWRLRHEGTALELFGDDARSQRLWLSSKADPALHGLARATELGRSANGCCGHAGGRARTARFAVEVCQSITHITHTHTHHGAAEWGNPLCRPGETERTQCGCVHAVAAAALRLRAHTHKCAPALATH